MYISPSVDIRTIAIHRQVIVPSKRSYRRSQRQKTVQEQREQAEYQRYIRVLNASFKEGSLVHFDRKLRRDTVIYEIHSFLHRGVGNNVTDVRLNRQDRLGNLHDVPLDEFCRRAALAR